jgi:arylsulfatase A-like enzyme
MTSSPRNILWVMVDCMRADVMYDRKRYASLPNLDAMARESATFTTTISAATVTTPSVATMLTGKYPAEHGVRSLLGYKLQPGVRTLPEILREHGYHTVAEMTGPLFPVTGLDRGFDIYHRRERKEYLDTAWGSEITSLLRSGRLPEPWFMFLHLWELHWPRKTTGEFSKPEFGDQLYQRSIAYLDSQLPRLVDALDPERSILVVTGDHGEGIAGAIDDPRPWVQLAVRAGYKLTAGLPTNLKKRILSLGKKAVLEPSGHKNGHHGRKELAGHAALQVYDYLVRVPTIIRAAGVVPANRRIDTQIRHIDIVPTLLDAVGVDPAPFGLEASLLPMTRGEDADNRPAITEALPTMLDAVSNRLVGFRTGRYKYICAPDNPGTPVELYDLTNDPEESDNIASTQAELAGQLREQLEQIQSARGGADPTSQRMSAEEEARIRQRLEELGYLE